MLIFHLLCERGIWYQVLYDLGIFQVRLDALSLEKLENLLVLFPFENCEQGTHFSEIVAVILYPVSVVARAFE